MDKTVSFFTSEKVLTPIVIIIVTLVLSSILKGIVTRIFNKNKNSYRIKKSATIANLVNKVITVFIYIIAIIMILSIYGIDTSGLIASLGIAGAVLGLALQDTVQDLMAGINIVLSNYYVIGDIVKIKDFTGTVIELSLKNTKIKSLSGEVYIFANHDVGSVINYSQSRAGVIISIPTAYEEKTDKVEKALKEIVQEYKDKGAIFEDSQYLGIDELSDSSINYTILIYCQPQDRWKTKREVLRKIVNKYDELGIKIPYNQIEVHNGKNI